MSDYVEEKEFTLRLVVRYRFPETYEGENDGYTWAPEFASLAQGVVQAAFHSLTTRPQWTVRPANRGRASEDEVTLVVERIADDS